MGTRVQLEVWKKNHHIRIEQAKVKLFRVCLLNCGYFEWKKKKKKKNQVTSSFNWYIEKKSDSQRKKERNRKTKLNIIHFDFCIREKVLQWIEHWIRIILKSKRRVFSCERRQQIKLTNKMLKIQMLEQIVTNDNVTNDKENNDAEQSTSRTPINLSPQRNGLVTTIYFHIIFFSSWVLYRIMYILFIFKLVDIHFWCAYIVKSWYIIANQASKTKNKIAIKMRFWVCFLCKVCFVNEHKQRLWKDTHREWQRDREREHLFIAIIPTE